MIKSGLDSVFAQNSTNSNPFEPTVVSQTIHNACAADLPALPEEPIHIRFVSYKLEIHCRALRIRSVLVPDVPHRCNTRYELKC